MKMKRRFALFLALAIFAVSASACGDSGTSATNEPASSESASTESGGENDSNEESIPAESGDESSSTESGNEPQVAASGSVVDFDEFVHPVVKTNEDFTIGLLHKAPTTEDQERIVNQAKIECEYRGWTLIDAENETDTYARENWQALINQGCDAIIVLTLDQFESYADIVAETREKGIGVYCIDNTPIDGVISNTFMPVGKASMELMYEIGADLNWDFGFTVMSVDAVASHFERMCVIEALAEAFPNCTQLGRDGSGIWEGDTLMGYSTCQAWLQQFGEDLDVVFTSFSLIGLNSAEAIIQNGDPHGEETCVAFIDSGSADWKYLMDNTPVKYTYSCPWEAIVHETFEVVHDIQIEGMNPGDEGCAVSTPKGVIYVDGTVMTPESNFPKAGEPIHIAYNYYDPNDTDAWYNWEVEGGTEIYKVTY